jgi:hypothetical protein
MNVAWWALAVSALSLVVATGSLGWNIYAFRRSGPKVVAFLGHPHAGLVRFIFEVLGARKAPGSGPSHQPVLLQIYNVGRQEVDIDDARLYWTERGANVTQRQESVKFPYRLAANSHLQIEFTLTLTAPPDNHALGFKINVSATVNLGNRTSVTTNRVPVNLFWD